MSSDWNPITTCSRVSSGQCNTCKQETFFSAYVRRTNDLKIVLCQDCYESAYEPERAAARKANIAQAAVDRKRDLELALSGNLPGAIITENGSVLGPIKSKSWPYRQVLREGTFDNNTIQVTPMSENLSKAFFNFKPKNT